MLLTGTYPRSLDEKGRFALPRPLREALESDANTRLYLAPSTDVSLAIYTEAAFRALAERLGQGSPTSQGVRAFSRLFYAQATCVELDRQGRIRLPQELAAMAGIERELVLVGVRDHMEIWEPGKWQDYLAHMQPIYDEIAERAFAGQPSELGPVGSETEPPGRARQPK